MKRLTKEEKDLHLKYLAEKAAEYCEIHGNKREADNVKPTGINKKKLCKAIGAKPKEWRSIKEAMLGLGISISIIPYGGYYLGKEGEQATLVKHDQCIARGIGNSMKRKLALFGESNTLEDAKIYSQEKLGVSLEELPKMLEALGSPLPDPLKMLLLEKQP